MGFFSSYNKIETSLFETYKKALEPIGINENEVKKLLDESIKMSKKEGTYNLSNNRGNVLLEMEKDDDKIKQSFGKKRKEGVTDKDIKWWFNLNDVERKMMLKVDEMHRMALYIKEREEGKTLEQADATVRKFHPMYGTINDYQNGGDNRPLPLELKDRINLYIGRQGFNSAEFKKKIESFSTFNALVREEIKKGNI